jgi:hypothetical protein
VERATRDVQARLRDAMKPIGREQLEQVADLLESIRLGANETGADNGRKR